MAFNFSGLVPSRTQDIPAPSSVNDHEKMELARKGKAKMNSSAKESPGGNHIKEYSRELHREKKGHFMKLKVTRDSLQGRQYLNPLLMRNNGISSPMVITLVGKGGTKWPAKIRHESKGRMCLGKGWREFAKEHGLKRGGFFSLELVWKNGIPMLKFYKEAKRYGVEMGESSAKNQNRFLTLSLTNEDVRDCKLVLPNQFMWANGINKLGKIIFIGKNKMQWPAYLSKGGMVNVGYGWKNFCEVNGVKIGDSFILEVTGEQDTNIVLKFWAQVFL